MPNLPGTTALVTGASRGNGRAIAERLATIGQTAPEICDRLFAIKRTGPFFITQRALPMAEGGRVVPA